MSINLLLKSQTLFLMKNKFSKETRFWSISEATSFNLFKEVLIRLLLFNQDTISQMKVRNLEMASMNLDHYTKNQDHTQNFKV